LIGSKLNIGKSLKIRNNRMGAQCKVFKIKITGNARFLKSGIQVKIFSAANSMKFAK